MVLQSLSEKQPHCPSAEELIQFDSGLIAPDLANEIGDHLDRCENCLETLAGLSVTPSELEKRLRHQSQPLPSVGNFKKSSDTESIGEIQTHVSRKRTGLPESIREYKILRPLGAGGMGVVYLARHEKLDKLVAVKFLPETHNKPAVVARFEREMRLLGQCDHPAIVRALDAGEWQGQHYLVMEYVEGEDLSLYVKKHGPVSVTLAWKILSNMAAALAEAHSKGIIHRDLKPSNLLLSQSGQIKLLDLGLARLMDDAELTEPLSLSGQVLGTPDYMAPEQWDAQECDGRTDLYALGCTLFYLLTGRAPFADEQHRQTLRKMKAHCDESPPDLYATRAELLQTSHPEAAAEPVPQELTAIYQKLVAKLPEERFPSANEVVAAIQEYHEEQIPPSNTRAQIRSEKKTHRPKLIWWLAGGCLVLLAGIVIKFQFPDGRTVEVEVPDNTKIEITQPEKTQPPAKNTKPPGPVIPAEQPNKVATPFTAAEAVAFQQAWADHFGLPVEYENSIGMSFRLIPPGEFLRGSTKELRDRLVKEGMRPEELASTFPRHSVELTKPFYLSVFEVTQGEYWELMQQLPGQRENARKADHPVTRVNWRDAVDFLNRLSEKEKLTPVYDSGKQDLHPPADALGYRLPTEAEWEFACLAGRTSLLEFTGRLEEYAWVDRNSRKSPGSNTQTPSPVGKLKPNGFGLYDIQGNLLELCDDFYAVDAYQQFAGTKAVDPTGPKTGTVRVARGGHYTGAFWELVFRYGNESQGFRPALSVEAVRQMLSK